MPRLPDRQPKNKSFLRKFFGDIAADAMSDKPDSTPNRNTPFGDLTQTGLDGLRGVKPVKPYERGSTPAKIHQNPDWKPNEPNKS